MDDFYPKKFGSPGQTLWEQEAKNAKNVTEDLKHGMHTHDDSESDIGWVPSGHTSSFGHVIKNTKMVISTNPWS